MNLMLTGLELTAIAGCLMTYEGVPFPLLDKPPMTAHETLELDSLFDLAIRARESLYERPPAQRTQAERDSVMQKEAALDLSKERLGFIRKVLAFCLVAIVDDKETGIYIGRGIRHSDIERLLARLEAMGEA